MAACSIFEEDEVSVITNKGYKCGLVVESSEYVSTDEEEDSYSPEFVYQRVRKGLVRVAWHPDGTEDVVQEKSVKLVDRSLMPGDVVRRFIEGQDSQRGYVRNTEVMCHVQVLGKNKVIRNISSEELEPLRVYEYWDSEPGDVTLDSWVGKIEHINEEVTLKFPDNAMCQVCDDEFINELFRFEDVNEKRARDTEFCTNDYYPGQQFKGELGDLESAKWIKSTSQHSQSAAKKNEHKEVIITVDKVEAKSIDVHWLCRGYAKVENPLARMEPPPRTLSTSHLNKLKKLDCFEACSVQLGDKAFYTLKPTDLIEPLKLKGGQSPLDLIMGPKDTEVNAKTDDTKTELGSELQTEKPTEDTEDNINLKATEEPKPEESLDQVVPVVNGVVNDSQQNGGDHVATDDADDSDYEDEDDASLSDSGSTASARSNASQSSTSSTKGKKKGKGLQSKLLRKKKLKKTRMRRESNKSREMRAGDRVPVEIIYTFSIIEVMWQDGSIEKGIASTELYPIHHLDELEFFPGDFVVRNTDIGTTDDSYGVVESVDHLGRTCQVRWMKPYQVGKSNRPDESIVSEEMSVYDIKDHPDYKFRPGHVVVRVGGYEESHSEAAGQVLELTKDGRLLIQWADKTATYCFPQELYLIGDELSDLGSELDSSSDESDDEDSGDDSDTCTEASWETEEEEEVEKGGCCSELKKVNELVVARQNARKKRLRENADHTVTSSDTSSDSCEMDDDGLDVEPDKKFELDMLLDTARNTLQKLEDTFAQNVDITPCTIYCYREILSINRNCKELDRMLSSSYFAETKLVETIQTIKKELKREKAAKIARQVLELFESNCKQQNSDKQNEKGDEETSDTKPEKRKKKGTKDGGGRTVDGSGGDQEAPASPDTQTDGGPLDASGQARPGDLNLSAGAPTTGGGSESSSIPTAANIPESAVSSSGGSGPATASVPKPSEPASGDASSELVAAAGPVEKGSPMDAVARLEAENALRAKDLCQEACRLLKEQIMKVHEDLEKKWQKLQEAGLLPRQDDEGVDDALIPQDKLAAVEKLVASAAEATANAMAMLTPTKRPPTTTETPDPKSDSGADGPTTDAVSSDVTPQPEKTAAARGGLGLDLPSPDTAAEKQAWEPPTPQTPAEVRAKLEYNKDGFHMMESVPNGHRFKSSEHNVSNPKSFFVALKKELKMLHTSLPKGIFVKGFEDRMDLFSVMIHGPARTPYEDSLFFFDVQLSDDYPTAPPSVSYISFCTDRLNPNLYEDGKVCVSLLGTWAGRGTEVWTSKSSLLQVLISIQGLILVPEPYYNEAGYEKQKGTQQGLENSRMYNEMAILKMVQSMMKMVVHPPAVFEKEVMDYMSKHAFRLLRRLEHWLKVPSTTSRKQTVTNGSTCTSSASQQQASGSMSNGSTSGETEKGDACIATSEQAVMPSSDNVPTPTTGLPEFPLLPASRGFQITLTKTLEQFRGVLQSVGLKEDLGDGAALAAAYTALSEAASDSQ